MILKKLNEKKEKKVMYKKYNLYPLALEHLIGARLHIGHLYSVTDKKINSYALGIQDKVFIFDLEKSWFFLRSFYHILSWNAFKRVSFFMVATNKNIPNQFIGERLNSKLVRNKTQNNFKFLDMIGFIHGKWIGGILSNWNIVYNFIKMIKKKKKKNVISKRHSRIFKNLQGVWSRNYHPSFPDIILSIDGNYELIREAGNIKAPLMGLIDSNVRPLSYVVGFLGNDDSLDSIEFFFFFIEDALKEGRKKEQEIFYYMLLLKIKNLIL